jgi:nitrite reductase/ring-hydroxylating ferredoxin subunit
MPAAPSRRGASTATRSPARWHDSVFRLADGRVVHGPATSRQVSYRARISDGQVELQGPHD